MPSHGCPPFRRGVHIQDGHDFDGDNASPSEVGAPAVVVESFPETPHHPRRSLLPLPGTSSPGSHPGLPRATNPLGQVTRPVVHQDTPAIEQVQTGVGGEVSEPQRLRSAAHPLDEPVPDLFGETRSHEVPALLGLAEGHDGVAAGTGQPTGGFQRLSQDGCEIGTFADSEVGLAQSGCVPAVPPSPAAVCCGRSTVHPPSPRRPVMDPDRGRINGTGLRGWAELSPP